LYQPIGAFCRLSSVTSKTAAELFSEIPEPRDTRERILFTALDLFHAHGFHAIGLDRILAEVG
jgi:AcrR family transcriptional regulator